MTRFRRNKDELARGLTPEQAKAGRFRKVEIDFPENRDALIEEACEADDGLPIGGGGYTVKPSGIKNPIPPDSPSGVIALKKGKRGEIVLRIRPAKGVDADYFEFLPKGEVVVEQDQNFYQWVDNHLDKVYDQAGPEKFFQDLLTQGIREILTNVHFTRDIKNGNKTTS